MTVENVDNLLVAGKSMAQSFHANSNTRLHPSEWTTGVAAGGAAVLMVRNKWSTTDAFREIATVQKFLNSSAVGTPLLWSDVPDQDTTIGTVCELNRCGSSVHMLLFSLAYWCTHSLSAFFNIISANLHTMMITRCFGVDAQAASKSSTFHNASSTCGKSAGELNCTALAADEWLANVQFWTSNTTVGSLIYSIQNTVLKKSTAVSGSLPPSEAMNVDANYACRLLTTTKFAGYWLCAHQEQA
jgi:hypothetical protein